MDYTLEVVVVPVTDVDRSKRFYADQMGFVVDLDDTRGDAFRIVQLTPRGSGCSIIIGRGMSTMTPGSLQGLQLCVADIETAHAELSGRGVPVSTVQHHDGSGFVDGKGGPWNSFIFFSDPDGNEWAIQEKPASGG